MHIPVDNLRARLGQSRPTDTDLLIKPPTRDEMTPDTLTPPGGGVGKGPNHREKGRGGVSATILHRSVRNRSPCSYAFHAHPKLLEGDILESYDLLRVPFCLGVTQASFLATAPSSSAASQGSAGNARLRVLNAQGCVMCAR